MVAKLPGKIPGRYVTAPGQLPTTFVDTGGYDFLIGGHGFRFATDPQNPYSRASEPTTVRRFDNSNQAGEQSLSQLPWWKSQSSFHGGAGQQNLEQGFTDFQYQQEQISHIRYDTSQGVDVWTPGKVTRLPTTLVTGAGVTATCCVTATVGGVDYAVYGGSGGFFQAAWSSGPDVAPTITAIDLSGSTYGGASNCNITSLATDGVNYYGVVQMTAAGFVANLLTYIVSGVIGSTTAPTALYECPPAGAAAVRTNLCTNPDIESGTTGWAAAGTPTVTITQDATQHNTGTKSLKSVYPSAQSFFGGPQFTFTSVNATTYTASCYVFVPAGQPAVAIAANGTIGTTSTVTNAWQRLYVTFTASGTSTGVTLYAGSAITSSNFYLDDMLIETGATLGTYFSGNTASTGTDTYAWTGTANASTSTDTPIIVPMQNPAVLGWAKARLMAGVSNKAYELNASASPHSALPAAKYTHPQASFTFSDVTQSPRGVLLSGAGGSTGDLLELQLDTSGNTPTLGGGVSVWSPPPGELIFSIRNYLNTTLSIGTSRGLHLGAWDAGGNLLVGPASVTSTAPVYASAGRDRLIYAGWTNQQPDGKTGLVAVDTTLVTDSAGRLAYAPSLRPPTSASTGLGTVYCVGLLPKAGRVLFVSADGLHVEGGTPGADGTAFIRTSRIRYDTTENKMFKAGRITGTLDSASISITASLPFGVSSNAGTLGFVSDGNPGEFGLPTNLAEWLQLTFTLNGAGCILNSYRVRAYPAPQRQHIITLRALCFASEKDKGGLDAVDPEIPRVRYQNVRDMEAIGKEVVYVEFTNTGAVTETVLIDQMEFQTDMRPNLDDDFGGYINLKLRITE